MPDDIVDTAKRWERHIGKETGGGMWWRGAGTVVVENARQNLKTSTATTMT